MMKKPWVATIYVAFCPENCDFLPNGHNIECEKNHAALDPTPHALSYPPMAQNADLVPGRLVVVVLRSGTRSLDLGRHSAVEHHQLRQHHFCDTRKSTLLTDRKSKRMRPSMARDWGFNG